MAVARGNRYGWQFTLVVIDVDRLKTINDTEGHQAGDAALRELGGRFRQVLRIGDDAARIGGDEFAMILPNTPPEAVEALLQRVRTVDGLEPNVPVVLLRLGADPGRRDRARCARRTRRPAVVRGEGAWPRCRVTRMYHADLDEKGQA